MDSLWCMLGGVGLITEASCVVRGLSLNKMINVARGYLTPHPLKADASRPPQSGDLDVSPTRGRRPRALQGARYSVRFRLRRKAPLKGACYISTENESHILGRM